MSVGDVIEAMTSVNRPADWNVAMTSSEQKNCVLSVWRGKGVIALYKPDELKGVLSLACFTQKARIVFSCSAVTTMLLNDQCVR